ncbi:MAG: hypothetical protein F6K40_37680 [Okeania sp. SIO3I5]|uniref:AAA-like domain-containing protein n=1 Tax=Okeania sp. SIO3I5 TaxID=2607805 RepID=UPI0013BBB6DC|nr:AAA-like domain-containing protein [Okeania sp. SIO3I5]NEQ41621.1 hypothetical protein [Okeania sp. SIO3I5]
MDILSEEEFNHRLVRYIRLGENTENIVREWCHSPPGTTITDLAEELHLCRTAVSKRLSEVRKCFGIDDNNKIPILFYIYKPYDYTIHPERLQDLIDNGLVKPIFEDLSTYLPLDSPYYIPRGNIEDEGFGYLTSTGNLLRISGCHQNGKTSEIKRILYLFKNKRNYNTVYIDLKELESSNRNDLKNLLNWFLSLIRKKGEFSELPQVEISEKSQNIGLITQCGNYVNKILEQAPSGLAIGLDNIDSLFEFQVVCQDFLRMLRVWQGKGGSEPVWRKLKIIIAYTRDYDGDLELNGSPFNIGEEIILRNFSEKELKTLIARYGLPIAPINPQVKELIMELVGGIPYLTRLGLYHIALKRISIEEILNNATTSQGIFGEHLSEIRNKLQRNSNRLLAKEMKKIIDSDRPINIDNIAAKKLIDKGLIKMTKEDRYICSCQLYRLYLKRYL